MDWKSLKFDWNQVRAFLVTAEEGTLSAASRALGLTQPTLGRQVSALEDTFGISLFERVGRTMSLTEPGIALLEHARTMGEAASDLSLTAAGQTKSVEGHVAITATDAVAMYLLPPVIAELRKKSPGINIEVIASNENQDLRRREADIAIRHSRPEQPDLIARNIGEIPMHLYATTDYLEGIGRPGPQDDMSDVEFVGFDRTDRLAGHLREMGLQLHERAPESVFGVTSENGAVVWSMIKSGLGIGVMAMEIADKVPELELAFPELEAIQIPLWLVTHRELRTSSRIRTVFDALADSLGRNVR